MKKRRLNTGFLVSFLVAATLFFSCRKEEDTTSSPALKCPDRDSTYKLQFKNQDLQGYISGKEWKYEMANINTTTWIDNYTHEFELIGFTETDSCFSQIFTYNTRVLFYVTDTIPILTPGSHYLLDTNFASRTGSLITLVHAVSDTSIINIITDGGGYEILTVDTISRLVTGKMDICRDEKSYINGYFEAKYCYW